MGTRLSVFVLAILVGLLALMVLQVPLLGELEAAAAEAFGPLQRTASGGTHLFSSVGETISRATELKSENELLRAEVEALQAAGVRASELEYQNEQLLAQLGYKKEHPDQQLLPANVIAREPTDLVHALTIDRGNRDGVQNGMTVVSPAGLVGRVLETGPFTAKVLLVTDSKSSVSGVVVANRAQGMVYGRRQKQVTMRFIDQMEKLEVGQWVVTSSLGGGFPPGIPIGRIVYVRQRDVEPFQEATIEPAIDFSRIDSVQVITSFLPVRRE